MAAMTAATNVRAMRPYHRVAPSPTHPGRWLVVHTVPGTHTVAADEDCPSQAAALRRTAQLEAQRIHAATAP